MPPQPNHETPDAPGDMRALVCQLGAREHYLVARCFARYGLLAGLVTDFWSPLRLSKSRMRGRLPKVVMAALARSHPELDGQHVASTPVLSLLRYGIARFDRTGRWDGWIAQRLARYVRRLHIPHEVFFGYSYDSLEILRDEHRKGVFTILCQTDPGPGHYRMVSQEEDRWPDYVQDKSRWWTPERAARLREEWDLADVIVVNSEWTREAILAEGADAAKIEVLPLAYAVEEKEDELSVVCCPLSVGRAGPGAPTCRRRRNEEEEAKDVVSCRLSVVGDCARELKRGAQAPPTTDNRQPTTLPLRVLWLGNVALGKGIQYLVDAARLLADEPVEIVVAGALHIAPAAIRSGPNNMRWLGRIPRNRTHELYRESDVFVFPTLSDGFGITQLEAMSHGLPVITTPNCGRVVEEGKTGFVIPPRDPQALADAIRRFASDRNLAASMAPACREAVEAFSVEAYGRRLIEIIQRHLGNPSQA